MSNLGPMFNLGRTAKFDPSRLWLGQVRFFPVCPIIPWVWAVLVAQRLESNLMPTYL
jgi:hypothetical protein